jgi:hypothetical protein
MEGTRSCLRHIDSEIRYDNLPTVETQKSLGIHMTRRDLPLFAARFRYDEAVDPFFPATFFWPEKEGFNPLDLSKRDTLKMTRRGGYNLPQVVLISKRRQTYPPYQKWIFTPWHWIFGPGMFIVFFFFLSRYVFRSRAIRRTLPSGTDYFCHYATEHYYHVIDYRPSLKIQDEGRLLNPASRIERIAIWEIFDWLWWDQSTNK